jgi:ABC-type amino acid transport substrate-binding protein/mono/diheme cytochrome c family protein
VLAAAAAADERSPLRVCADPDNLPFTGSGPHERGFYLELADIAASRMGTTAEPVFFPTGAGRRSLRPTLVERRCDVFFGLPYLNPEQGPVALTRPFIELGYAVVLPTGGAFRSLDDLDGTSVGVQFASTAQTVLSTRDRVELATFRSVEEAIDALAGGKIASAVLWGPVAGYRVAQRGLSERLKLVSVKGRGLRGQAAAGVRRADTTLLERLDRTLAEMGPDILMLAARYHFPLDPPVDLAAASAPVVAQTDSSPEPAPALAEKTNPYRGDPEMVKPGRTLFNTHCSHCHSPNAQNPEPRTDLRRLNIRYREKVNEVFYATVTQGRPTKGMPPWGHVLDEQTIWKIKTFLESVQRSEE